MGVFLHPVFSVCVSLCGAANREEKQRWCRLAGQPSAGALPGWQGRGWGANDSVDSGTSVYTELFKSVFFPGSSVGCGVHFCP